ncbi:hypothetical protein V1478_013010, partial [Vespula squamosa]
ERLLIELTRESTSINDIPKREGRECSERGGGRGEGEEEGERKNRNEKRVFSYPQEIFYTGRVSSGKRKQYSKRSTTLELLLAMGLIKDYLLPLPLF